MAKRLEFKGTFGGSGVSSWNDLTDKPFYEEGGEVVIEWDGSTEGRDSATVGSNTYYKVSELTPTAEELAQATCTSEYSVGGTADTLLEVTGAILVDEMVIIANDTTIALDENTTLTVPSTGMYFAYAEPTAGVKQHATSLSYGNTNITWDGDIAGRDFGTLGNGNYLYKVSDLTPTVDELANRTAHLRYVIALTVMGTEEIPGGLLIGSNGDTGVVIYDTAAVASDIGTYFPSTGVYFNGPNGDSLPPDFSCSITYDGSIIHPLDPKFLPKGGVGWVEKNEVEPTTAEYTIAFDGVDQVSPTEDLVLYKIGEQFIEYNALAGAKVTLTQNGDSETYTISSEYVMSSGDLYAFLLPDIAMTVYFVSSLLVEGIEFPSTGVYINCDDTLEGATLKIEAGGSSSATIHRIDDKFIPDTVARMEDIPEVPTSLPNPNKLILSGLATGEYDGSQQVAVDIQAPPNDKNWNQYDPEASDYISNRTHWDTDIVTTWFDGAYSTFYDTGDTYNEKAVRKSSGCRMYTDDANTAVTDNTRYKGFIAAYASIDRLHTGSVTHGNTPSTMYTIWWIGNAALYDDDEFSKTDTGESYLFVITKWQQDDYYTSEFYTTDANSSINVTLKGYTRTFKALDDKFIPSTIARTSQLPAPAPAIPDLTAAPTMEDFNNLLAALRTAGYLATE